MIQPGKPTELAKSYRSAYFLFYFLSKLFKKLLLSRINIIIENYRLIPDHQFSFRSKHATTEQIYRIVKRINNDMEADKYCSAVFLDVSQAFDKVWHRGLLYKIKKRFSTDLYSVIRCYLLHRTLELNMERRSHN